MITLTPNHSSKNNNQAKSADLLNHVAVSNASQELELKDICKPLPPTASKKLQSVTSAVGGEFKTAVISGVKGLQTAI